MRISHTTTDEKDAVDDGQAALDRLLVRLVDVPTPAGPTPRHIDHELIEAAYAQPRLRALFPFTSHYTLCLSQCTRFPFTHDLPVINPIGNGRYRVSWPTRSPTGPAAIGETDNPHDAAALLVDHLPETCGPAVDATADDLDTTDSTE